MFLVRQYTYVPAQTKGSVLSDNVNVIVCKSKEEEFYKEIADKSVSARGMVTGATR